MVQHLENSAPNNNEGIEISNFIEEPAAKFKVYKTRWFILALFWFISSASMMQFMIYAVIADILVTYYDISYTTAGWSSMICMLTYLLFVIPGSYMLDAFGVKTCTIITMISTCAAAWIKLASVDPSMYWVLLLGQGVAGAIQSLTASLPIKIAAVWFGSNEVSTACAIGIAGVQVGFIVGILIPPMVVQPGTFEEIQSGLHIIACIVAGFTTLLLIIVVFCLPDRPPNPPSYAQYTATRGNRKLLDYIKSMKTLFSNSSFVFLLLSSSLIFGTLYPMMINLNQLIMYHYLSAGKDVGYILALSFFSGIVGSFFVGIILDKWQIFKLMYLSFSFLSSISLIVFMELVSVSLLVTYGTSALLGFAAASLYTVAIEVGVEMTYPEPQSISGTLIYASCQVSGLVFTYAHSALLIDVSVFWSNMVLYILMIIGNLFLFGIRYTLKRKNVENELKKKNSDVI